MATMTYHYSVESEANPSLVYSGFILMLVNAILLFLFRYTNPDNLLIVSILSLLILPSARVFFSIWAYRVAKKLNRNGLSWAILTFVFPPISLIVLGTRDVNIKDELRDILEKYISDYSLEKQNLKKDYQNGKIDNKTLKNEIEKAKEKYDKLMNVEIQNANERIEERNRKATLVKFAGNDTQGKCPTCATKLPLDTAECPVCGLKFK
jgi:hypothetical protein